MNDLYLGWNPEAERQAKAAWTNSPPRFFSDALADVDVSEPAFTLANQIKFWQNQGPVGSCFSNAVTQSIQLGISCAVEAGGDFDEVQLSRSYVWYWGRYLDGSIGSRSDGGTITNAMRAVHEYGIPLEKDWPYKPEHNWLERKPTQAVIDSAKAHSIKGMLDLKYSDTVGIKRSIKSGLPPVTGIYWEYSWDRDARGDGIITTMGGGVYGHALVLIGWAVFGGQLFWHICNSHGPIYGNLTGDYLKGVKGYAGSSDKATYNFWVSDRNLQTVASYGYAELVAPVTVIAPHNQAALSWLTAGS